jgi:RNA polymerase sigma-70 factor (ECF subfamily)
MDTVSLFEILAREHAPMLTAYLRSVVHDPAAVDDFFQEAMLTAWKSLDRYDRSLPFGPWLRGIAARLILADRRRQSKSPLLCDEQMLQHLDHRFELVESRPGDTFDEKLIALRQCIEALPPHYREVVQLRYRMEMPSISVTEALNINMETLKKRLQRARASLLDCLNRKLALTV